MGKRKTEKKQTYHRDFLPCRRSLRKRETKTSWCHMPNPSTQEAEAGELQIRGQLRLHNEPPASLDYRQNNSKQNSALSRKLTQLTEQSQDAAHNLACDYQANAIEEIKISSYFVSINLSKWHDCCTGWQRVRHHRRGCCASQVTSLPDLLGSLQGHLTAHIYPKRCCSCALAYLRGFLLLKCGGECCIKHLFSTILSMTFCGVSFHLNIQSSFTDTMKLLLSPC